MRGRQVTRWCHIGDCLDECASGCRLTKDEDVNAHGMSLASEAIAMEATVDELFSSLERSLACWADDDDMSHVTVGGHGQRVPD